MFALKSPVLLDKFSMKIGTVLNNEQPYFVSFPRKSTSKFPGNTTHVYLYEEEIEFAEIVISPLYKVLAE